MESDLKSFAKKIEKLLKEKEKNLNSLMTKEFACEADAISAVTDFVKTLKYHNIARLQILGTSLKIKYLSC